MEIIQNSQGSVEIQLGLWDSIMSLLLLDPIFLLGIIVIGILLVVLFKKNKSVPKVKISIVSLMMYYYLSIMLAKIVGIPTLSEFRRLSRLGENLFNPNINLIPLSDGLSLSFILNIFLFIPLGLLCPMISRTYERIQNTILIGVGLSLFIEITQLFTLYRATDINDLLTNVIGTVIGYLCFRLISRLKFVKMHYYQQSSEKDFLKYLPIVIIVVTFTIVFIS